MGVSEKDKVELSRKLQAYLSGEIDHEAIKSHAWKLSDFSPVEPGENDSVFWSIIFSIIHLSDEEHWKDGCTQRDLGELLAQLTGGNT